MQRPRAPLGLSAPMHSRALLHRAAAAALIIASARLGADTVDTRDGAHLVGKVTKIDAGVVTLSTTYSNDITVKQQEIVALATDQPVAVRLSSGTRFDGRITTAPGGAVQIAGADATASTSVGKIAAVWPAGEDDPQIAAMRRHWTYEASTNIAGTSGNKSSLGTEAGFKAKLVTPQDTLQFYADYNRQVSAGEKSADQFKAGLDYAAQFSDRKSWYVKDEAGFDRVMDIRFQDVAAAGVGYDIIKTTPELLTGRVGLSYRYEGYTMPATPAVSSAGLDLELNHEYHFHDALLENKLAYVPAFQDFSNYTVTHQSSYTIPLHQPNWKLQMGVENDYDSKPPRTVKRLDTTYYTRLLLDWGH